MKDEPEQQPRVITIRLDQDMHETLRRLSFEQRRPMSVLIREAIRAMYGPDAKS